MIHESELEFIILQFSVLMSVVMPWPQWPAPGDTMVTTSGVATFPACLNIPTFSTHSAQARQNAEIVSGSDKDIS